MRSKSEGDDLLTFIYIKFFRVQFLKTILANISSGASAVRSLALERFHVLHRGLILRRLPIMSFYIREHGRLVRVLVFQFQETLELALIPPQLLLHLDNSLIVIELVLLLLRLVLQHLELLFHFAHVGLVSAEEVILVAGDHVQKLLIIV